MKIQNVSKLAMWVGMGIAVLVLGLFFVVGFDNPSEEVMDHNEPQFTNLLIYTMYAFVAVLAGLTIWNLVLAVTKFRDGGLMKVIAYCGGSIILYIILRLVCGGQEAPEGAEYTGSDMALADAYIYTIYVLFLAAIVVSVICATGILTKSAVKNK